MEIEKRESPIELVLEPKTSDIGGGFLVRRTLPSRSRRMVGPFIFFDHMGPVEFPPGKGMKVLPHPHIGLATVTYLFDGEILHRDSAGFTQAIRPGAINWMVAGRGIVHSERVSPEIERSGQTIHGIQLWVALPEASEDMEPAFFHHSADSLPRLSPQPGLEIRILIGSAFGVTSPVHTYSRMLYAEAKLSKGCEWTVPVLEKEQALYVATGSIEADSSSFSSGSMLVIKEGQELRLSTSEETILMILGGDSPGKRKIYWNFVHSRPEVIEQAKQLWKDQKFPAIEGETEFVPLPE